MNTQHTTPTPTQHLHPSLHPSIEQQQVRSGALLPRLALVAKRPVSPGEELTFDYGESRPPPPKPGHGTAEEEEMAVGSSHPSTSSLAGAEVLEGRRGEEGKGRGKLRACLCGAAACRGTLPFYAGV